MPRRAQVVSAVAADRATAEPTTASSPAQGGKGSSNNSSLLYTRFHWPKELGGEEVFVWGSFNAWAKGVKLHRMDKDSIASVVIPVQPGDFQFKYVVDTVWCTAPFEPTVTNTDGSTNNYRVVAPSIEFSISAPAASQVLVVGDWDDWQYSLLMTREPSTGIFSCKAHLKPGEYSYYYVVDDEVVLNPDEQYVVDPSRGAVHKAWSYLPDVFRLFYCTGWADTVLHYRRVLPEGTPKPEIAGPGPGPDGFYTASMLMPSNRRGELGLWKMACVVPSCEGEQIEFFLSNGLQGDKMRVDKPGSGPLYTLPARGSFKLTFGQARPFMRGGEPRVMVVSDLDGTMFGEVSHPSAFDSSQRFLTYWDNNQALAGGILVYNTGRSLGQFTGLMRSCEGRVAVPDVLVTAVGTKVWKRVSADGLEWSEDLEWAARLDKCWNLGIARSVAKSLCGHYNHDQAMVKIADDGSEHQHRLSIIADKSVQAYVTKCMVEGFQKGGMDVRIIVSGAGSHRYIDIVPVAAGKEQALQYVRQKYQIPEHLCVAAGDSGNDILMLEGDHPGIVVGNAQGELLHWMVQTPQTGKVVITEAMYADGIMEGMARHGLL